jgi:hypothetical protein
LYDVAPFTDQTGKNCFNIDVRHIKLMTTGKGTQANLDKTSNNLLGVNRVVLYFDEAPLNRARDPGHVKIACVDVRYVDNMLKSPWDGQVSLASEDFQEAKSFKWDSAHCKNLTSIPMPTRDAGAGAAAGGP